MENNPVAKPNKRDAIASKKIKTRITKINRRTIDSPLNVWVKDLPLMKKRLFYNMLFSNKQLWGTEPIDKSVMIKRWNNYRYKGIGNPHYFDAILIFCTAKHIDPDIKFSKLFPDIPHESVENILPDTLRKSLETENFSKNEPSYA